MGENGAHFAWTTFGRYALLDKIGAGGMAEIYRAKTFGAAGFEKEFAIKLILPSLVDDTEFVDMFINEAKIAVSLYHANIVQVFDLGEIDTQYYIAMEFVHGMDLLDVLARCANLELKIPFDLVLFVTMEMLKGLDFAHRAKNAYGDDLNIVHRDVSPSNVLISYAGDVKIGDFGVAKAAIQRNLTETGTLKGKVGYMSPEQVVGDSIDWRSDIFAAGIVFFEALSMSRLFVGNSDLDVMLRVRDADIDDSVDKAGPMPAQLESIVRRSLAKHREERFQTAGDFYQALVDFCYQHRIKVNGSNLSNFMRRVFAEEIEAEKNRRLTDGDSPKPVPGAYETPPPARQSSGADIQVSTGGAEVSAELGIYRYRDAAGLVYGPLEFETLVALLGDRNRNASERVSTSGGDWQELGEVAELAFLAPTPVVDPVKALQQAAMALEEISLVQESSHASDELLVAPELEAPADRAPEKSSRQAIDALRDQYAAYQGTLARVSLARLLARLHRTAETGRLYVTADRVEKSIFFEHGEPVLVDSNREDELLGEFLISREVITQPQLEDGLARLSEWGGRLGDALVAVGAIPAHQIFKYLSDQMQEKILEVFTWSDGTWGYFENQQPETHGYPLGIDAYATIVEGCLQRMPIALIINAYSGRENTPIHMQAGAAISTDELRLSGKALRILNLFTDGDSLAQLVKKTPTDQQHYARRILYLLHQVEIVTFEDTLEHDLPGD